MQVPQALLDERARIEKVIEGEEAQIGHLRTAVMVMRAKFEGLDTAIALIEGSAAREAYEWVAPPAEIAQAAPVPGPHAPGREPRRISIEPRAARRNIKELVAGELRLANADGLVDRGIAGLIDALLLQVRGALSKLAAEGKAHYDPATDRWHWGPPQKAVRKVTPPEVSAEPASTDPALPETIEPVYPKLSTESLVVYLGGRPEGRAVTELCEVGYHEADIRDAEVAGEIWLDARGFYHAAIGGSREGLEAAQ